MALLSSGTQTLQDYSWRTLVPYILSVTKLDSLGCHVFPQPPPILWCEDRFETLDTFLSIPPLLSPPRLIPGERSRGPEPQRTLPFLAVLSCGCIHFFCSFSLRHTWWLELLMGVGKRVDSQTLKIKLIFVSLWQNTQEKQFMGGRFNWGHGSKVWTLSCIGKHSRVAWSVTVGACGKGWLF